MGNSSSSSSSPFSSTSFNAVSSRLPPDVLSGLESQFRLLSVKGVVSRQSFIQAVGTELGPTHQAPMRLFSFLTGTKVDGSELSFERWVVGVYLFHEALHSGGTSRQTQLLFSMFDSKQVKQKKRLA
jgi:hypothetical protein